ncbi:MAG: phosphoglycolate phosphatase, partial [Paracoccaceae bacterium]
AFNGGRAMLRLGYSRLPTTWDEDDVNAQYPRLLEYYAEHIDVFTVLYPGVERSLDLLAGSGFALGICTNKPAGLAEILLARLGIRERFGAMLGADSLPVRKPDPEHLFATIHELGGHADRSVLVGDTITDRKTAQNANIPCILVTFGPKSRDVIAMNPEALLDHYDDLPNVVSNLNL